MGNCSSESRISQSVCKILLFLVSVLLFQNLSLYLQVTVGGRGKSTIIVDADEGLGKVNIVRGVAHKVTLSLVPLLWLEENCMDD